MKILIVSPVPTHPTYAGNSNWILSQAQLLKGMGHDVHFLYIYAKAFKKKNKESVSVEKTCNFWGEKCHIYQIPLWEKFRRSVTDNIRMRLCNWYWRCDDAYPRGLHKKINRLDNHFHFDAIIINYYYLSKCLEKINIPLKALSTHDCFSFRDLNINAKGAYTTYPNDEAKALQRCPHIFALQDEEKIYFKRLAPKSRVYSVFSTYDFHEQPVTNTLRLLFFSGPNTYNKNGLKWFLDEIFPTLKDAFKNIELLIGGGICADLKECDLGSCIKLMGRYDDPSDFYRLGDIVINPTYQGTGLKIKTFEGISYGKVVMAHPHSITGIYNVVEAPIFHSTVADEWVEFLKNVWEKNVIEKIKEKDKLYILSLNEYVKKQYKMFLETKF